MRVAVRRVLLSPYLLPALTLLVIGLVFVEPLRRSDLLVFLRAAGDVAHGANPYTPTDDPFLWGGSAFVYPYLMAFLFVPLTWVPVVVADGLWFVACGAAVVGACRVLGLRDPIGISAVLLSSTCIRSFQVGAINSLLLLAAALAWRYRERLRVLVVAFTFLAGSKLFLLPMAVWVLLTRSRRAVVVCALSLGAFLGAGLVLEPISVGTFLRSMSLLAQHEGHQGMSLQGLLARLVGDGPGRWLPVLLGAAVLGAAAVRATAWGATAAPVPSDGGRLGRLTAAGRSEAGDLLLFSASIIVSMAMTPVYWSHYTVIVVAVLLAAWPSRRTAVVFALASWVVSRPDHVSSAHQLSLAWRTALLFGAMLAVLAVLAVLVAVGRRRPPTSAPNMEPPIPSPAIFLR